MQGGGPRGGEGRRGHRGGSRGEGGARVKSVTWKSAMEAGATVGEEMGSRGHLRCARAGALSPSYVREPVLRRRYRRARACEAPPPLPALAGSVGKQERGVSATGAVASWCAGPVMVEGKGRRGHEPPRC